MKLKNLTQPEKWIIFGIPVLFAFGAIFHFLYGLSGNHPFVALFTPANESVWEHSKMLLLPVILWWALFYFICGKKYEINQSQWFEGAFWALLSSLILMPMLYYFYTEAFGAELLWVDIFILLLCLLLGQLLGLHIYRKGKGFWAGAVLIFFAVILLLYMLATFSPPHIPLFQDGVTGRYGITLCHSNPISAGSIVHEI